MAFLGQLPGKSTLGNKIGGDISEVLQGLAQHKTNQMKLNQQSQFWKGLGLDQQTSQALAQQPESIQKSFLDKIEGAHIANQQQNQGLQAAPSIPQQSYTPEQINLLKSIQNPLDRQKVQQQIQQQYQPQQAQSIEPSQRIGQAAAQQQAIQTQQQGLRFKPSAQQVAYQNNINKQNIDQQTRRKIVAEKYYDEKLNQGEEAGRKLSLLQKMKELVPQLSGQRRSNIARITGNTLITTSPETQAFDKFAADLLPQGLTQEQLKSERLKFPNSGLSAAANKKLINDLEKKYYKEAGESKIAESIVDLNNGNIPENFRQLFHYATKEEEPLIKKKDEIKKNNIIEGFDTEEETPEEGFISSGLRNIISSGANAISSLAHLPELPEKILKWAESNRNNAIRHALKPGNEEYLYGSDREKTKKGLERLEKSPIKEVVAPIVDAAHDIVKSSFPKNYLQPKNKTEETLQDYAAMIPLYLLGGGSKNIKDIAGFLGRTAVGKNIGEAVKQAGGGETGKIASQLLIPPLLSTMNPYRVAREFKKIQDEGYKNLPGLAGDKKIDASPLSHALEESWDLARHGSNINRHQKNISEWEKYIDNGKFDLKELQPLSKKINKLAYSTQQTNEAYIPIAKALKKMGEDTLKTAPEYGKALLRSNGIYSIYANAEDMKGFLSDTLSSIPTTKKSLIKKGLNVVMQNPAIESAKTISKLINRYPKEVLNYSLKAFQAANKKQSLVFLSEIEKLGKLSEKVEE